ncbi:MAG: FG-GAP-like repeat-containing protein, partial [Lentisphaerota bacterium]
GDDFSVVIQSVRSGGAIPFVELQTLEGTAMATGVLSGAERVISNAAITVDGVYYLRVASATNTDYNLVVLRNAVLNQSAYSQPNMVQPLFRASVALGSLLGAGAPITEETEPNDDGVVGFTTNDIARANDWRGSFVSIAPTQFQAVLTGSISAGDNADWDVFKINAAPRQRLIVDLSGSGSGGGTLSDAYLYLYNRNGVYLTSDDDSGPGLDAHMEYASFSYTGEYYVVADSFGSSIGTYRMTGLVNASGLVPMTDNDSFGVRLSAGDVLQGETFTPADGPGEYENLLDPSLWLYDPSAQLVATATNGAPDQRNARLAHTAAMNGLYRLQIKGGTTVGDYALRVGRRCLHVQLTNALMETDGMVAGAGRVWVDMPAAEELSVTLSSSDATELVVPSSLTLAAGATSATFAITAMDDQLMDGAQVVNVSATALGWASGSGQVTILDDEAATWTLSLPASALETAGLLTGQGRMALSAPADEPYRVELESGDLTEVLVPAEVTILAGQTSAVFDITLVDDSELDGSQRVALFAGNGMGVVTQAILTVLDNETRSLRVMAPTSVVEGAGTLIREGKVCIGGVRTCNIRVDLFSSDPAELAVPLQVTVYAGTTQSLFNIQVQDDSEAEGAQRVILTASVEGFEPASCELRVLDNELHHFAWGPIPAEQYRGIAFPVRIMAQAIDGITIPTFTGIAQLEGAGEQGPASLTPTQTGPFVAGVWDGGMTVLALNRQMRLTARHSGGVEGQSGVFDVTGPICGITPGALLNTRVIPDETVTRNLNIANTGNGTLHFQCAVILSNTFPSFAVGKTVTAGIHAMRAIDGADLDGDGDLDLAGAAVNTDRVLWFENVDGRGGAWTEHLLDPSFNEGVSIQCADLDRDGDQDVVAAARYGDLVAWWENTDGHGGAWTRHLVDGAFNDAFSIRVADIDGDGDPDVLGSSYDDHVMVWWENTDGGGLAWTKHILDSTLYGSYSLCAADMDLDGDQDVLATASGGSSYVALWKNQDGHGQSWSKTIIAYPYAPSMVKTAFIDSNAYPDVIMTCNYSGGYVQWIQNPGTGTYWSTYTINYLQGGYSVDAADLDGDGDQDVLATGYNTGTISWFENRGGFYSYWSPRTVASNVLGTACVRALDVDGNGTADIAGSGDSSQLVGWWRNDMNTTWCRTLETSGSVAPGETLNLAVLFDATGMNPIEHREAMVRITCNDMLSPTQIIPASIDVRGPDLTVTQVAVADTLKLGQTFPLRCVTANSGAYVATNFMVSAYLSHQPFLVGTNYFTFESELNMARLVPGESVTNIMSLIMPDVGRWPLSDSYLLVKVDSRNQVPEGDDETNNVAASSIIHLAAPALLGVEIYPLDAPDNPVVPRGMDVEYAAIGFYENDIVQEVTPLAAWHSSDGSVADWTSPGHVRALQKGIATLSATLEGLESGSQVITVTDPIITNLAVRPSSMTNLHVGQTAQLDVFRQFSDGQEETVTPDAWWMSDDTLATVTPNGLLVALRAGAITLKASLGSRTSQVVTAVLQARIAGRVTGNGENLSGARVYFSGPQAGCVTSTADGAYSTPWLPNGSYSVHAEHASYLSGPTNILVLGPNMEHTDLNLTVPRIVLGPDALTNGWVVAGSADTAVCFITNSGTADLAIELQSHSETNAIKVALENEAIRVALFYNAAYVNVGAGSYGCEASNVKAVMEAAGFQVRTFTGITAQDFKTALEQAEVLYIPELEMGSLGPALTGDACTTISNFVNHGGGLVINGDYSRYDGLFLRRTLGISPTTLTGISDYSLRSASAVGTEFENCLFSVYGYSATCPWMRSELPANTKHLYTVQSNTNQTSVALIGRGRGQVALLAWDWFNAAPVGSADGGWNQILAAAVRQVCTVTKDEREETHGRWDMTWSGPLRHRGNVYRPGQAVLLIGVDTHLGLALKSDLAFFVYEGRELTGAFTNILLVTSNSAGPGEGWYRSPALTVLLKPDHVYYIGAAWRGNATYGRGGGSPADTGLGELVSGAPVFPAGFPPPSSLMMNIQAGEIAPYYQRVHFSSSSGREP